MPRPMKPARLILDDAGEPGGGAAAAAHVSGDVMPRSGTMSGCCSRCSSAKITDAGRPPSRPGGALRAAPASCRSRARGRESKVPCPVDWQPDVADIGPARRAAPSTWSARLIRSTSTTRWGCAGGECARRRWWRRPGHEGDGELARDLRAAWATRLPRASASASSGCRRRPRAEFRALREHRAAPAPGEQHGAELGLQGAGFRVTGRAGRCPRSSAARLKLAEGHGHEVGDLRRSSRSRAASSIRGPPDPGSDHTLRYGQRQGRHRTLRWPNHQ